MPINDKLYLPEIYTYKSIEEFFTLLYEVNKSQDGARSFAFWAKLLNWPRSYIPDLIAKKKTVSASRLIQFSKILKLDICELEYLLCLHCIVSKDPVISRKGKKIMEAYYNTESSVKLSDPLRLPLNSALERGQEFFCIRKTAFLSDEQVNVLNKHLLTLENLIKHFQAVPPKIETTAPLRKLIFPDITKYLTFSHYLKDFISLNRKRNFSMSAAFLSRKLQWSPSLLKGLITGKRQLTVSRALQFADFAELSLFETERILKLCLHLAGPEGKAVEYPVSSVSIEEADAFIEKHYRDGDSSPALDGTFIIPLRELQVLRSKLGDIRRWLDKAVATSTEVSEKETRKNYFIDLEFFKVSDCENENLVRTTFTKSVKSFDAI